MKRNGLPLAVLALLACTLAALAPLLGNGAFFWDDGINILANPQVTALSLDHLATFWRGAVLKLYAPLPYTAWSLLYAASVHIPACFSGGEANAVLFHAANLLLHAANGCLVLFILRRLTGDLSASLFGALLFCLHPVQVESAAWVSELRGLLATLFCLLSLLAYLRSVQERSSRAYVAAILLFVPALLSKPSATALPLMLVIVSAGFLDTGWRQALLRAAPWFALSLPLALATSGFQPMNGPWETVPPLWLRPVIALDALASSLGNVAVPAGLCIDYGRTPEAALADPLLAARALAPVALAAALLLLRRRDLACCLALFAAGLLPQSGLVPFDFQIVSTVADRYGYLAMLGPALALALLMKGRRGGVLGCGMALVVLLGAASYGQARLWRDGRLVYEHALEVNPRSWISWVNLGHAHAPTWEEKIFYFRQAVRARPDYLLGLADLAWAVRQALADPAFDRAKLPAPEAPPEAISALVQAADAAQAAGRPREAVRFLGAATALYPMRPDVLARLGNLLLALDRPQRAGPILELARALSGQESGSAGR